MVIYREKWATKGLIILFFKDYGVCYWKLHHKGRFSINKRILAPGGFIVRLPFMRKELCFSVGKQSFSPIHCKKIINIGRIA